MQVSYLAQKNTTKVGIFHGESWCTKHLKIESCKNNTSSSAENILYKCVFSNYMLSRDMFIKFIHEDQHKEQESTFLTGINVQPSIQCTL